jgi:hypothetical protein
MALSTTRKGNLTIAQYVGKLTSLADEMAKRLDDEDLVGYNLVSLDSDFDGVISTVATCVEPIFVSELYGQLVSHEQRQELRGREYPMANSATRGVAAFLAVVASVRVLLLDVDVVMEGTTTPMVENSLSASCVVGRGIRS